VTSNGIPYISNFVEIEPAIPELKRADESTGAILTLSSFTL
jgi:hypothetical protein